MLLLVFLVLFLFFLLCVLLHLFLFESECSELVLEVSKTSLEMDVEESQEGQGLLLDDLNLVVTRSFRVQSEAQFCSL